MAGGHVGSLHEGPFPVVVGLGSHVSVSNPPAADHDLGAAAREARQALGETSWQDRAVHYVQRAVQVIGKSIVQSSGGRGFGDSGFRH